MKKIFYLLLVLASIGCKKNSESPAPTPNPNPQSSTQWEWKTYNTSNSGLASNTVTGISAISDGTIWVGTDGGGACRLMSGSWTSFNQSNSILTSDYILAMTTESNGNCWMGVFNSGAAKINGNTIIAYNTGNCPIQSQYVYSCTIAPDGKKWFGTGDGIAIYDNTSWTIINGSMLGLTFGRINDIAFDAQGNAWLASDVEGLIKYNGSVLARFDFYNSGILSNHLNSVFINSDSKNYVGSGIFLDTSSNVHIGGLSIYDGTWANYNSSSGGLATNTVLDITKSSDGAIWLGSYDGLFKFSSGTFTAYNTSNSSLPNNNVYAVCADPSHGLWIGTDGGLTSYK
jgi:ligand-binding sensor domain-containing protein